MRSHYLPALLTLAWLMTLPEVSRGQHYQKGYATQKCPCHACISGASKGKGDDGRQESGNEPKSNGGYAQPPGTGTISGATQGIGLEGLEIEIPKISLKLPGIKFPGLTRFIRPPHMQLDGGVAPFVNNVVREFTVPGGAPESGDELPNPGLQESGGEPTQKPFQKVSHCMCDECRQPVHAVSHSTNTGYLGQVEARERALEARVQELQNSLELLLANQQALLERGKSSDFDTPHADSRTPGVAQVQYSHYLRRIPAPEIALERVPTPAYNSRRLPAAN